MDINKAIDYISRRMRVMAPDGWEVFSIQSINSMVGVNSGKVETRSTSRSAGISVRVMRPGRMGFSYSSDLSEHSLDEAVDNALAAAKEATEDELQGFIKKPEDDYPEIDIFDAGFNASTPQIREDRALAMEAAAFEVDKRIQRTRSAEYSEHEIHANLLTSSGIEAGYKSTFCKAQIMVVAEENGESEAWWDDGFSKTFTGLNYEEIGRKAAFGAVSLLGGKRLKSMQTPAIIDAPSAAEMLGLLARAALADQVAKQRSLLVDMVGEKIFSDKVTILDDALMDGGAGTAPFDGEGNPSSTTTVADNGVLASYLYDSYWAKKLGRESTGNSRREGFTSKPGVGVTNFYLKPGGKTRDELLKELEEGFLITGLMGVHTANPVTGDFSFGAQGQWIKGGKIEHPVGQVAVAGNILEMFGNIVEVGNDMKYLGRVGSPSILIDVVNVGGE